MNKYPINPILFVDDEVEFLESCNKVLQSNGFNNVVLCSDSREVLPLIEKQRFEAILLDIGLPHITGIEILKNTIDKFPFMPVIMLTASDNPKSAVECMKLGAYDYMMKPINKEELISTLKRSLNECDLRHEVSALKRHLLLGKLEHPEAFSEIVTDINNINSKMYPIFQYSEIIAGTSHPTLIIGETGVGKELLAKAIHNLSGCKGDFVVVNTAGLDDTIFSNELFGHVKGAFTGAETYRKGLIEQAAGGTLLLDEIGELTNTLQVKLLRLLQNGEYYALGTDKPKKSNARIITCTNKDLNALQKEGKFRDDLYYRLSPHEIIIPPLRKRLDDLPILVEHYIKESSLSLKKKKPSYPKDLLKLLRTYSFPGNIREFKSLIFNAVNAHQKGILSMDVFRQYIARKKGSDDIFDDDKTKREKKPNTINLTTDPDRELPTLKEAEIYLEDEALKRAGKNQGIAAEILGLTRAAMNKRLIRRLYRQKTVIGNQL